jgi:RNA polymerase sigma-70 factor (ECF subfamily)
VTFESLYEEQADYLYTLAVRLTGSRAEADDLMQETCLRVYKYLSRYRGESLRGWLRTIMVNAFYYSRRNVSKQPVSLATLPAEGALLTTGEGEPERLLDTQSLGDMERALQRLSAEHRTILVLRELEDLSYDELASHLGVAVGTVRSRLARARAALRGELNN